MGPWPAVLACAGALVGAYLGAAALIAIRIQREARQRRKAAQR